MAPLGRYKDTTTTNSPITQTPDVPLGRHKETLEPPRRHTETPGDPRRPFFLGSTTQRAAMRTTCWFGKCRQRPVQGGADSDRGASGQAWLRHAC